MVGLPGIFASGTLPSTWKYTGVLYKLVVSTLIRQHPEDALLSVVKLHDMVIHLFPAVSATTLVLSWEHVPTG